jgi:4-hydroxy-tetrahydrodipicolinate synthase
MIDVFGDNPKRAREIHQRLMPVFKALFSAPSPVPVKYATSLNGFDCEEVRLPLVKLSEEQKQVVRAALVPFVRVPV